VGEEQLAGVTHYYRMLGEDVPERIKKVMLYHEPGEKMTGLARAHSIFRKIRRDHPSSLNWYVEFKDKLTELGMPQEYIPEAAALFAIFSPKKPVEMNLAEMFWTMKHYRDFMLERGGKWDKRAFKRKLVDIKAGDVIAGRDPKTGKEIEVPYADYVRRVMGADEPTARRYERSKMPLRVNRAIPAPKDRLDTDVYEGDRMTRRDVGMMFAEDQVNKIVDFYDTAQMAGDLKTKNFFLTLIQKKDGGFIPFTVNDVQVGKIFGVGITPKSDTPAFDVNDYRVVQHWFAEIAQMEGVSPDEVQAAF
jgi:hypothetical protein